jgi:uncharacterized phage protein (TIGR02220 family)
LNFKYHKAMKQKSSFILHIDSLVVLDALTDEQAGQLFRVIRDYHCGKDIECDAIIRVAFMSFQAQFKRDAVNYVASCNRNGINGAKGGRPKKELKETQKTQSVISKPKKADSDSVSVSDSDSVSVSDSDSVSDSQNSLVVINHNNGLSKKNNSYEEFIQMVNRTLDSQFRGDAKSKKSFTARMKDGYTIEQIEIALNAAMQMDIHRQSDFAYLTPEFITRQDKLEMYINRKSAPVDKRLVRDTKMSDAQRNIDNFVELMNQNKTNDTHD